jgi:hypothetical protein
MISKLRDLSDLRLKCFSGRRMLRLLIGSSDVRRLAFDPGQALGRSEQRAVTRNSADPSCATQYRAAFASRHTGPHRP